MDNPWELYEDPVEIEPEYEAVPECIHRAELHIDMAVGLGTFATIKAVIFEGDYVIASTVVMALLRRNKGNTEIAKVERKNSIESLLTAIAELMSEENQSDLLKWFALHLRREIMTLTASERLANQDSL